MAKESLELFMGQENDAGTLVAGQETDEAGTTLPTHAAEAQVKWRPPLFGRYKLNWDVALDFKNKLMGIGVVVRDHHGEIMAALRRRETCSPEPVQAESAGALVAAEFSRDLGLQDLILEGDSSSVVSALRSSSPNWSPHGQIIEDACGILFSRRSWEVLHVKRGANMALLTPHEEVWIEKCPPCIFSIIDLELNALVI
jgi:ribonuclease HI